MTLIGQFSARRTTPALADDPAFLEMSRRLPTRPRGDQALPGRVGHSRSGA
jgi:hypothetical protein